VLVSEATWQSHNLTLHYAVLGNKEVPDEEVMVNVFEYCSGRYHTAKPSSGPIDVQLSVRLSKQIHGIRPLP